MKSSSNPYRAEARAEINIYDTLDAVEHFAANYPAERIDIRDANRLLRAAALMIQRASHAKLQQIMPPGTKVSMPVEASFGTHWKTDKHLGPIPPVDPALQRLLDVVDRIYRPVRHVAGGCVSVPVETNHTIGWSERNADL
jgi:hypothetical protein